MSLHPTVDEIRAKAGSVAFGSPLIVNAFRGLVAEIVVGAALGLEWRFCSGDWPGWDFEHFSGCRLEVKQSAAQQTWAAPKKARVPIFDIRARTGYYEGADWIERAGRHAHIYVFSFHPITGESADHCDPSQWRFHVVAASRLPSSKTISLTRVVLLSDAVTWIKLREAVESLRVGL